MKTYNQFNHTADIGVYFTVNTKEEGFVKAGWILFDLLTSISKVESKKIFKVKIKASDIKELLINWLNELIFLYETKHVLFKEFKINKLSDTYLEAEIFGEKINHSKHIIYTEIKAATYHQVEIRKREKDGYYFKIVFDT